MFDYIVVGGGSAGSVLAGRLTEDPSVRVCLLMRSAEAVISAEDPAMKSYLDCDGVSQTSTDGLLRRAYFNTTALRSKMPL